MFGNHDPKFVFVELKSVGLFSVIFTDKGYDV